jgi:hypothetical protein
MAALLQDMGLHPTVGPGLPLTRSVRVVSVCMFSVRFPFLVLDNQGEDEDNAGSPGSRGHFPTAYS